MRDYIVELAFMSFVGFVFLGVGFLMYTDISESTERFNTCIAAGMVWDEGSCVK